MHKHWRYIWLIKVRNYVLCDYPPVTNPVEQIRSARRKLLPHSVIPLLVLNYHKPRRCWKLCYQKWMQTLLIWYSFSAEAIVPFFPMSKSVYNEQKLANLVNFSTSDGRCMGIQTNYYIGYTNTKYYVQVQKIDTTKCISKNMIYYAGKLWLHI